MIPLLGDSSHMNLITDICNLTQLYLKLPAMYYIKTYIVNANTFPAHHLLTPSEFNGYSLQKHQLYP